jgi:hypothetical protein
MRKISERKKQVDRKWFEIFLKMKLKCTKNTKQLTHAWKNFFLKILWNLKSSISKNKKEEKSNYVHARPRHTHTLTRLGRQDIFSEF